MHSEFDIPSADAIESSDLRDDSISALGFSARDKDWLS